MKFLKIFSVLALSAMTLNLSAALNAKAQLVFTSAEATTNYLISQDDAVANDFTSTNCGKVTVSPDAYALYAYTEYNSQKYAAVELNDINGTIVKFQANPYETSYTLTISNVEGDVKVLKEGVEVVSPLTFTCAANAVVEFEIKTQDNPTYTREGLTVGNLYTFCVPGAVDADKYEGAMFFKVNTFDGTSNVDLVEVEALEAGMPYFFEANATTLKVWETEGSEVATAGTENGLYGWLDDEPLAINGTEGISILKNNVIYPAGAGLFVGKNRAYLKLDEIGEAETSNVKVGGQHRVISGHNAATGVENVVLNGGLQKVMVDGQLMIIREGHMYNAAGVQVK